MREFVFVAKDGTFYKAKENLTVRQMATEFKEELTLKLLLDFQSRYMRGGEEELFFSFDEMTALMKSKIQKITSDPSFVHFNYVSSHSGGFFWVGAHFDGRRGEHFGELDYKLYAELKGKEGAIAFTYELFAEHFDSSNTDVIATYGAYMGKDTLEVAGALYEIALSNSLQEAYYCSRELIMPIPKWIALVEHELSTVLIPDSLTTIEVRDKYVRCLHGKAKALKDAWFDNADNASYYATYNGYFDRLRLLSCYFRDAEKKLTSEYLPRLRAHQAYLDSSKGKSLNNAFFVGGLVTAVLGIAGLPTTLALASSLYAVIALFSVLIVAGLVGVTVGLFKYKRDAAIRNALSDPDTKAALLRDGLRCRKAYLEPLREYDALIKSNLLNRYKDDKLDESELKAIEKHMIDEVAEGAVSFSLSEDPEAGNTRAGRLIDLIWTQYRTSDARVQADQYQKLFDKMVTQASTLEEKSICKLDARCNNNLVRPDPLRQEGVGAFPTKYVGVIGSFYKRTLVSESPDPSSTAPRQDGGSK